MNILLFGVSNVGKTTIGKLLAEKLRYTFYDLDEIIKERYNTTLEEFVQTGTIEERDRIRGQIIRELTDDREDKDVAVTPMPYLTNFQDVIKNENVVAIELRDTEENIFERLIFGDENGNVYRDDAYKNVHAEYYLREIRKDIEWYGYVHSIILNKYDINNKSPDVAAEELIRMFYLE